MTTTADLPPLLAALRAAHGRDWQSMSRNDRQNAARTLQAYLRALAALPLSSLAPHTPTPAAFAAALRSLAE